MHFRHRQTGGHWHRSISARCIYAESLHFYPQNTRKRMNGHYQANTKIFKLLDYQNDWGDFNQILHSDKDHQVLVVGCLKICPTNPKWQMDAILKKVELLYFSNGLTHFWCNFACRWIPALWGLFKKSILKNVKCDISATVWWILMKFGMTMPVWSVTRNSIICKTKMADGGHLENCKITISQKLCCQFWRNFTINFSQHISCVKINF